MPSKYAPDPDKVSKRVIRFFEKRLDELNRDEEDKEKERSRFKSIYSSVIDHAMKRRGQSRKEAHKYALKTYIERAPEWAGNLLKKRSKA
jgi:hypothetical protein